MLPTFKEWLTLDRIHNDWWYSKENCKWSTKIEQNNNKSDTIRYKWKTLSEWSKIVWLAHSTIYKRIDRWLSIHEAIHRPMNSKRNPW